MKSNNSDPRVIGDILGKPINGFLDDDAKKVRRNLIFASFVCLSISLMGINVSSDSTILGIKFVNLKEHHIRLGLGFFVIYFLSNFAWLAYESFKEWEIRSTGINSSVPNGTRMSSLDADNPNDPRNSTLYSWWIQKSIYMDFKRQDLEKVISDISRFQKELDSRSTSTTMNVVSDDFHKNEQFSRDDALSLINNIRDLKVQLDQILRTLRSRRLIESIRRFDNKFYLLIKSQNLRWLIFDIGLPIFLGISSLIALWFFYPNHLIDNFCRI